MRRPLVSIVSLLMGMLLMGAPALSAAEGSSSSSSSRNPYPVLAPCSGLQESYKELQYSTKDLDDWPDLYHGTVNRVINEHLRDSPPVCSAEDYSGLLKPGSELLALAKKLPPWKEDNDRKFLSRAHVSYVLLENQRIYECALAEQEAHFGGVAEKARTVNAGGVIEQLIGMDRAESLQEAYRRIPILNREIRVSRVALHRTLTLIGGYDRLRPLEAELQCTQMISLDLKNLTALAAETSACQVPRGFNARDVTRDIKEE